MPISFHFTWMTASMAVEGTLWPNVIRCNDVDDALKQSQGMVKDGYDPYECMFGCLTVYDDGRVRHQEFSVDELK